MALPLRFKAKKLIEEGRTSQNNVDVVRKWLEKEKFLDLQEEFVVLFLIACDNNTDETKKTILAYFRIKNGLPRMFNDFNKNEMKELFDVLGQAIIPKRLNNSVIVVAKYFDTNYRKFGIYSLARIVTMTSHFLQISNPPEDVILLFDVAGVGFMHLTSLRPTPTITVLKYVQEAQPIKIRSIYFLNSSYVIDRGLSLFKTFIKGKLMQCIRTLPPGIDWEEIYKVVPASHLPKEYGGELGSFRELAEKTREELEEVLPFMGAEQQLRSCFK